MDKKENKNLDNLNKKSSILIYGDEGSLQAENEQMSNIIQSTITDTVKKFGSRTGGNAINYFKEIGFSSTFSELFGKNEKKTQDGQKINGKEDFKRYMSEGNNADINGILLADSARLTLFDNYDAIFRHIPECAQALDTYKDNIMSPDDYTKLIFNLEYDSKDEKSKKIVEDRLDFLREKYKLEEKAENILEKALLYGENYVAVLSIDDDLSYILNDPVTKSGQILSESEIQKLDPECINLEVTADDITLTEETASIVKEVFGTKSDIKTLNESTRGKGKLSEIDFIKRDIAKLINENIQIGSRSEILAERVWAETEHNEKTAHLVDIPDDKKDGKINRKKSGIGSLGLNGSSIKFLDVRKVVDLSIDDISYGYYYVEDGSNRIPGMAYLGNKTGREVSNAAAMAPNNTLATSGSSVYNPGAGSASDQLNVSEEKLKLISQIFIDSIAKKVNRDFIKKNKKFQDFIYDLVRQNYIIKRAVKITYFFPEEVVKFQTPALYRKILFFAKLYLSILTNDLLIKLGRSHDKRVFYVNTGLDADYEQAVSKVIQDIKTKEYKMDNFNDINTILNLNPGRFDDYYMPTINGDRPVEIDTLQGMDAQSDNDFLEYLRNSMLTGIGVPRSLIDALTEVDFARTLSAQNSVFLRDVVRRQKNLTPSFSRLLQRLYENEFRYPENKNDSESKETAIDTTLIKANFPSPASLNYSNLSDQIQSVDSNADFIANQLIPASLVDNRDDDRAKLKAKIVEDMLPGVDWDLYKSFKDELETEKTKEELKKKVEAVPNADGAAMDPYGGGF